MYSHLNICGARIICFLVSHKAVDIVCTAAQLHVHIVLISAD